MTDIKILQLIAWVLKIERDASVSPFVNLDLTVLYILLLRDKDGNSFGPILNSLDIDKSKVHDKM